MFCGGLSQTMAAFCFARYLSRSDSVVDDYVQKYSAIICEEVSREDFSLKAVHKVCINLKLKS